VPPDSNFVRQSSERVSDTVTNVTSDRLQLPFVDEHAVLVDAAPDSVWDVLGRSLPGSGPARLYIAAVGGQPRTAQGDPLVEGSTLPGFAVRTAEPGRRLVLAGRHQFSTYALTFTLEDRPDGTRLSARTDAVFPGVLGRLYRVAVISSGAHGFVVRRWLRAIGRGAQATGH
jgi:hypothetical protein